MLTEQRAKEIWQAYTEAWSVQDPARRTAALSKVVIPQVEYSDPLTKTSDAAELATYIGGFQQQYPGGSFSLRTFRYRSAESIAEWSMLDGKGAVVAEGVSYGRYAADGRLEKMAGFFPTA